MKSKGINTVRTEAEVVVVTSRSDEDQESSRLRRPRFACGHLSADDNIRAWRSMAGDSTLNFVLQTGSKPESKRSPEKASMRCKTREIVRQFPGVGLTLITEQYKPTA